MNFLEICQAVAQETGVTGQSATPLPTSVLAQTNELKRIVDWVAQEWLAIQGHRRFNWMWEQASLTMLANTASLAGTIPESRYEKETFYIPVTGQQGEFPSFVPWDEFRLAYPFQPSGERFTAWTIAPDMSIRVDIKPTANTPFTVERFKLPTVLAADADTPGMPSDLHMLLVYQAVVRYANFDEAGVQRATALDKIRDLKADLYSRCLPEMRIGRPMGQQDDI